MFKKFILMALMVVFIVANINLALANGNGVEVCPPGWYQRYKTDGGIQYQYFRNGHPINQSEWTFIGEQPPIPPEPPCFNCDNLPKQVSVSDVGDFASGPGFGWNNAAFGSIQAQHDPDIYAHFTTDMYQFNDTGNVGLFSASSFGTANLSTHGHVWGNVGRYDYWGWGWYWGYGINDFGCFDFALSLDAMTSQVNSALAIGGPGTFAGGGNMTGAHIQGSFIGNGLMNSHNYGYWWWYGYDQGYFDATLDGHISAHGWTDAFAFSYETPNSAHSVSGADTYGFSDGSIHANLYGNNIFGVNTIFTNNVNAFGNGAVFNQTFAQKGSAMGGTVANAAFNYDVNGSYYQAGSGSAHVYGMTDVYQNNQTTVVNTYSSASAHANTGSLYQSIED